MPTKDLAERFLQHVILPLGPAISARAQSDAAFSEKEVQGIILEHCPRAGLKGVRELMYKHFTGVGSNESMDLMLTDGQAYFAIELKIESSINRNVFGGETASAALTGDINKLTTLPRSINPSLPAEPRRADTPDMADQTYRNVAAATFIGQHGRPPDNLELDAMLAQYKLQRSGAVAFTEGEEFAPGYELEEGEIEAMEGVDYHVSAGMMPLHRWAIIMALTANGAGSLFALSQGLPNATELRCNGNVLYTLAAYIDP